MDYLNSDRQEEDHLFETLYAFTGLNEHSYEQQVEILQELKALPPPPLLRGSVQPIYHWSKALPDAAGIRADDVALFFLDLGASLMGRKDLPRKESPEDLCDVLTAEWEAEDQRIRTEWKNSEWIPFPNCSNTNATAYLRHLVTTKELVWSKDSYKTNYFMLSVGNSSWNDESEIPTSIGGSFVATTSKFNLDIDNLETANTLKKLRAVLKKFSLTQQSKAFLGENFIRVIDNTEAARPSMDKIVSSADCKLILEMKLNPAKKTVFFNPIGVAYRA